MTLKEIMRRLKQKSPPIPDPMPPKVPYATQAGALSGAIGPIGTPISGSNTERLYQEALMAGDYPQAEQLRAMTATEGRAIHVNGVDQVRAFMTGYEQGRKARKEQEVDPLRAAIESEVKKLNSEEHYRTL